MRAYKGFNLNQDGTLQCRDKTYQEGETYTEPEAKLCTTGMHACLEPIDVLTYYPPATSVYYEVEIGDDATAVRGDSGDSKIAATKLTVGAELSIAGLVEAQVAYAIGTARPVSLQVDTFGTGTVDDALIENAVKQTFDFRPAAIIETLKLRRPIYRQTAAYGHFGRSDLDLPWERLDRIETLKKAIAQ